MFHNYAHVCKQLLLCDVVRSCDDLLTPVLQVSHLFIRYVLEEKGKKQRIKGIKDHGTMDKPSLDNHFVNRQQLATFVV